MLTSLRSKLILAFAAVIFICLFSAGTGFVVFLRNHETEQAREKVGRLAQPLAVRVTYLEWLGLMPEQMRASLDDYAAASTYASLLVDKMTSTVLVDTDRQLEGTTVQSLELLRRHRSASVRSACSRSASTTTARTCSSIRPLDTVTQRQHEP